MTSARSSRSTSHRQKDSFGRRQPSKSIRLARRSRRRPSAPPPSAPPQPHERVVALRLHTGQSVSSPSAVRQQNPGKGKVHRRGAWTPALMTSCRSWSAPRRTHKFCSTGPRLAPGRGSVAWGVQNRCRRVKAAGRNVSPVCTECKDAYIYYRSSGIDN